MNRTTQLYVITNKLDGNKYVGVSYDAKHRFKRHSNFCESSNSVISNTIKKYGKENFNLEILLIATREYCYEMEKRMIEALDCRKPNGYNLCAGGLGSAGLCGELNGAWGRRGPLNPMYGKLGKDAAFYGHKHTEETKEKMRLAHTGSKRTPEQKENIRLASIKRWQNPEYREKVLFAKYGNKEEIS